MYAFTCNSYSLFFVCVTLEGPLNRSLVVLLALPTHFNMVVGLLFKTHFLYSVFLVGFFLCFFCMN